MRKFGLLAFALLSATPAAAAPPPPALAPYNWTGFYVGLNAGWNEFRTSTAGATNFDVGIPIGTVSLPVADSASSQGAIGGLQLGYNWQWPASWVVGFEADIQALKASGGGSKTDNFAETVVPIFTVAASSTVSHTESLRWLGTARAKLGYGILPNVMIYGTGGLAYGEVNEQASASTSLNGSAIIVGDFSAAGNGALSASSVRVGWTAGGGLAGFVAGTRATWKIEYLFVDLGSINNSFNYGVAISLGPTVPANVALSSRITDSIVRAGVDFHL